jgi:hypothetical protein
MELEGNKWAIVRCVCVVQFCMPESPHLATPLGGEGGPC